MASELYLAIEQIGREKGIDTETIIEAVEEAYAAASKKSFRTEELFGSRLDRETGEIEVFSMKTVVEEIEEPDEEMTLDEARKFKPEAEVGDIIEFSKPTPELGRIAAQAAKQVIYQKVKEAERENIHAEYSDRIGELVNGLVKRFERGDLVIDLGKTEAVLPRREQSRAEHYNSGDRIRIVIVDVDKSGKGPQVTASRADPRLLMKLFEMEVPEIYDGTVVVMSVAREAGDRAKIAVRSKDRDVDPVGACVGIKGSRVQAVIRELRGEKIDIVQWDDDARTFVHNALNPAQINRVYIRNEETKEMEVIVADDQLSLAIGKKGQNVRLASRLVGWEIQIRSESEKKSEIEAEMHLVAQARTEFERVPGLGDTLITNIIDAGYRSVTQVAEASLEDLTSVPGVGEAIALKIFDGCLDIAPTIEVERAAAAEEAARLAAEAEAAAAEEAVAAQALGIGQPAADESVAAAEKAEEAAEAAGADEGDTQPLSEGPADTPDEHEDSGAALSAEEAAKNGDGHSEETVGAPRESEAGTPAVPATHDEDGDPGKTAVSSTTSADSRQAQEQEKDS